eukprot:TRINITY_DN12715_c0_g1_i1.p1 TRINITY_DN12715_c0_g1~~TRINITY_DN12715_c0_g1_i1.p1  ORF type:complete len:351 (+),score=16.92 TRINITY_DN12715_c0_g1_i1:126-1055(+)
MRSEISEFYSNHSKVSMDFVDTPYYTRKHYTSLIVAHMKDPGVTVDCDKPRHGKSTAALHCALSKLRYEGYECAYIQPPPYRKWYSGQVYFMLLLGLDVKPESRYPPWLHLFIRPQLRIVNKVHSSPRRIIIIENLNHQLALMSPRVAADFLIELRDLAHYNCTTKQGSSLYITLDGPAFTEPLFRLNGGNSVRLIRDPPDCEPGRWGMTKLLSKLKETKFKEDEFLSNCTEPFGHPLLPWSDAELKGVAEAYCKPANEALVKHPVFQDILLQKRSPYWVKQVLTKHFDAIQEEPDWGQRSQMLKDIKA